MVLNIKLRKLIVIVALPIIVTACGKEKAEVASAVPQAANAVSQSASAKSQIDGYKNFKFGMSDANVLKLPECIGSMQAMQQSIQHTKEIKKINERIAERQLGFKKRETWVAADGKPWLESPEGKIYKVAVDESTLNDEKELADIKALVDTVDESKAISEFTKDGLICQIEFLGEKRSISAAFDNGLLATLTINVGAFNREQYRALDKSLSDKYGSNHVVTDESLMNYQLGALNNIATSYADNHVVLEALSLSPLQKSILENSKGVYFAMGLSIPPDQSMSIHYLNDSNAAKAAKAVTRGQVKSGDL